MTNCPCDKPVIFPAPDIAAGLDDIPRQIGGFPQFRRAMLATLREQQALNTWNARDEDDLGVMLLEMWAYVCDVLSFYDEAIANENYLRSADLRPSLRKLTGLLGYIPRPAVSASVLMTALAEGRKSLNLASGIAFRSEAFADEAPQVFELGSATTIHPLNNDWKLDPQRADEIGSGSGSGSGGAHEYILLTEENRKLKKQDVMLIQDGSASSVHSVTKRSEITGDDDEKYIQLELDPDLSIASSTKLEDISLTTPTQSAGLWTMGSSPTSIPSGETELILNGLYRQLKAGQNILVSKGDEYRWFELDQVSDTQMNVTTGGEYSVTNIDDETETLTVPPVQAPATRLSLDQDLNDARRTEAGAETWNNSDAAELIVHYGLIDVGEITSQRDSSFDSDSELVVAPTVGKKLETPVDSETPSEFVLQDVNLVSVQGNGSLDYATGELDFQGTDWNQDLTPPVKVFGNLLQASRGETVSDEILGSGDASQINQAFTLKKNPLTYIAAPTSDDERGVTSTLTVWVDGVQWQEWASFYGQDDTAEVYILRQNDDQETQIIFGDGIRGRRLPSGKDNIKASYRFGAGAAAPPADAITQLAKPVKGLSAVNNPFAASGGADAEAAEYIRDYAPRSALLLGRAVSVQDFIAAALGLPGVKAATAEWRWNDTRQRPVIQLWYIGDSDSATIATALRNLADPTVALDVTKAAPDGLVLSFDVEVDDSYVEDDVLQAVRSRLTDESTGMLAIKNIGIGSPLYRSQLFSAILAEAGTLTVTQLQHDETPFEEMAIKPQAGEYFDLASGQLIINGEEGS